MKITWIGHACFTIEKDGYTLVTDPYNDGSVPGLKNIALQANQVLCSHEHGDHNGRENITVATENANPFSIRVIDTYHDEVKGNKRGTNKIHIITDGTTKIAHLGDLGCELEDEQKEQLKGCDVILIPVGGFYTIDGKQAAQLIKELKPAVVIPMHYRDEEVGFGYEVISTVADFANAFEKVVIADGSEIDTEKGCEAEVVVLRAKNAER